MINFAYSDRSRPSPLRDLLMDLQQLETFLAVVEERSFSRAAQRLLRTQPAVSQVIRKLEDELGEPLFERALRGGSLTAAGEVLRAYAERLIGLRAEAASAVTPMAAAPIALVRTALRRCESIVAILCSVCPG